MGLLRALIAAILALISSGCPDRFELSGSAIVICNEQSGGENAVLMISDNSNTEEPFAALTYTPMQFGPNVLTLADLETLSATYQILGGGAGGGAPRFSVTVDTDDDGESDGSLFVYIGTAPNWTETPGPETSTGNLIESSDLRFDTSQLGGTFYDTFENAVTLAGEARILRVSFVLDAAFAFPGGVQTLLLKEVQVNDAVYVPVCEEEEEE